MPARVGPKVRRAAAEIGDDLRSWRKLQGLTAAQVAERAGISRQTMTRLENGDPSVSMATLLSVARAVGQIDRLADALDPMNSEVGRMRAHEKLPERVRPR